jgi:hypothetical protein
MELHRLRRGAKVIEDDMFNTSKKQTCPLLKKPCIEAECKFWTHLLGKDPQTGGPIDRFDCAVAYLPILLVEASRNIVGVQAATESARNEITERQDTLNRAVAMAQTARVAPPDAKRIE